MAKYLTDRERVKADIRGYERNKRLKNISMFGAAGSIGAAGLGVIKGKKPVALGGASAAFLTGMAYGRARREERASLNRIKRYYDLRERPKLINMDAVLPIEKHAFVGEIADLVTTLGTGGLHALGAIPAHAVGSLSHFVGTGLQHIGIPALWASIASGVVPATIGLSAAPSIATAGGDWTRRHAYIAAKDVLSKRGLAPNLTAKEQFSRGFSQMASAIARRADELPQATKLQRLYKGRRKWLAKFLSAPITGGEAGEFLGDMLSGVAKVSPSLGASGLEAIGGKAGFNVFKNELKSRHAEYLKAGKILDSAVDEIPGLRSILRASGREGHSVLSKMLEHPSNATRMAEEIKKNVAKGVLSSKVMLGAAGLAAVGALAGSYRKKHPLATNALPARLLTTDKKRSSPNLELPLYGPEFGASTGLA